jgi:hypothetical protein
MIEKPWSKIEADIKKLSIGNLYLHAERERTLAEVARSWGLPEPPKTLDDLAERCLQIIDEAQNRAMARNNRHPPKLAEFLLTLFATSHHADAAIGDLNERFTDECEKLGRPRAVRLYRARTLQSLWPLLRRAIGKALKWGAVIAAVRRLF